MQISRDRTPDSIVISFFVVVIVRLRWRSTLILMRTSLPVAFFHSPLSAFLRFLNWLACSMRYFFSFSIACNVNTKSMELVTNVLKHYSKFNHGLVEIFKILNNCHLAVAVKIKWALREEKN